MESPPSVVNTFNRSARVAPGAIFLHSVRMSEIRFVRSLSGVLPAQDGLVRQHATRMPIREAILLTCPREAAIPDRERGGQRVDVVRVIDWDDAAANDFLSVSPFLISL